MRPCRVPGCQRKAASRFAIYCSAHVSAFRRHGHPEQQGVPARDLKPYRERARRWLDMSAGAENSR